MEGHTLYTTYIYNSFLVKLLLVSALFVACKKKETAPKPVASFYAEVKHCQNDTCVVYFFDNSIHAVNRTWDFGNGLTSNLINDSTIYTEGQSYKVVLKVENLDGVENTKIKTIQL